MLVFVYGSLKKDFKYHWLIENAFLISNAETEEKFSLYRYPGADYPFMAESPQLNKVIGEVYEIDNRILRDLDRLEGYPTFYDRKKIFVKSKEKIRYEVLVYFLKEELKMSTPSMTEWTLQSQDSIT